MLDYSSTLRIYDVIRWIKKVDLFALNFVALFLAERDYCENVMSVWRLFLPKLHNGWLVMAASVAEEHVWVVDEACAELSWVAPQRLLDACEALGHLFSEATGDHSKVADGLHPTATSLLTFLVWRSRVAREPRHHKIIHQLRTFLLSHAAYLPTTKNKRGKRKERGLGTM